MSGRTIQAIRPPAVAGVFYPERAQSLGDLVDRLVGPHRNRHRVVAAVVPHGGYLSSGTVAAEIYGRIDVPPVAVIVGPDHAGTGKPWSIVKKGSWETPLGCLPVDEKLAQSILRGAPDLQSDPHAHRDEHAVELQLPFLQRAGKIRSFVPMAVAGGDAAAAQQLGAGIAQAIRGFESGVLLIASAHMSNYEPKERSQAQDPGTIQRIVHLDEMGLLKRVEERSLSMCGAFATAVCLSAAKQLGASNGFLVAYSTGEDFFGEESPVSGYAGILIQ